MPTYRVTDPDSGRTLKLIGDSPPTEAEIEQAFAAVTKQRSVATRDTLPEMSPLPDEEGSRFFGNVDIPGVTEDNPYGETAQGPVLNAPRTRTVLPMMAATAAAFFQPELAPALASRIPLIARLGSSVGAQGPAVPLGVRAVQQAPKIAAAGAGGGGAEALITQASGQGDDPVAAGVEGFKDFAAAEAMGMGAAKVIEKAAAPVASRLDDKTKKLIEFAKEKNIPMSIDALVPGMTQRLLRGGTDNFLPSRLVNDLYRKAAIERVNTLAADSINKFGPVLGKESTEELVTLGFQNAVKAKRSQAVQLSEDFLEQIGRETPVKLNNTKSAVNRIKAQAKNSELLNFIEAEGQFLKSGKKSAEGLETTLRQISTELGRVKGRDAKFITELKDAIKADFKAAGGDLEKLSQSDQFFARNYSMLSSKTARMLEKGDISPQTLTLQIFKTGNEDLIQNLAKELPPETWNALKAQNLANLIEKSSVESKRLFGSKVITNPKVLEDNLNNNRKLYIKAYGEDTVEALDNFINLAKSTLPDVQKFENPISLSDFAGIATTGGLGFFGGREEPVLMSIGGLSAIPIAMSLMSPKGFPFSGLSLKKWLTTGFDTQFAQEAAKLGIRANAGE